MEGLLIAEQLRRLEGRLPAQRLPWRFPDDRTAVLPLVGDLTLHIASRPPTPFVRVGEGAPEAARPRSPFQEQLRARAGGVLLDVKQPQLDRVIRLRFAGEDGFVPTPPVELVVELTGRNANLILVDEAGTILGVERQVLADRNRYRELRVGLKYMPPPPYSKLNPLTAEGTQLAAALTGRRLSDVSKVVDGVGPLLSAALARAVLERYTPQTGGGDASEAGSTADGGSGTCGATERADDPVLVGDLLPVAIEQLLALAQAPTDYLRRYATAATPRELQRQRTREQRLAVVSAELKKERTLGARRLADAHRALEGAAEAERLRGEADLLLAYAHQIRGPQTSVTLTDFAGQQVEVQLDPKLDAAGNARTRYDQARRREARVERAKAQLHELESALAQAEERLRSLPELADGELARLAAQVDGARRAERSTAAQPGIRFRGPHGFEVVVGRNARDNDKVTFGVGRSLDVWLHAQGYRGSHVIIRSGGKEVPFETVLFAARLAAGYSDAFRSANVPVDYTARKNVWKVKGGAPGAVNFTQHRTVYVTPARDDAGALQD